MAVKARYADRIVRAGGWGIENAVHAYEGQATCSWRKGEFLATICKFFVAISRMNLWNYLIQSAVTKRQERRTDMLALIPPPPMSFMTGGPNSSEDHIAIGKHFVDL